MHGALGYSWAHGLCNKPFQKKVRSLEREATLTPSNLCLQLWKLFALEER
jgi:hypothetical protein